MCELLGMSANVPTDICFSFAGLARRGGETGPHADGWGLTFYAGKGCRTFKDPLPAAQSKVAELVQNYPIHSKVVIAHVRQANSGSTCLENTHPFQRELWGRQWTFAHNGQIQGHKKLRLGRFLPIGETDSEHAFCHLLDLLAARYRRQPASRLMMFKRLIPHCHRLRDLGVFNALLTDGEYLLAYCATNLHYLTRRSPFHAATLKDVDWRINFAEETGTKDVVTVIATQPLPLDEPWIKMEAGEWALFHHGERCN